HILDLLENDKVTLKGEIVLVLDLTHINNIGINIDNKIKSAFLDKLPPKDAAKLLSLVSGKSKREIYKSFLDS
ncbi:16S rRNA (cytidine(1402)-2'-O)-methyltransferase, partial [Gammaproteobacteria bacterium]|nr:16S rRNA (cytidine(1402)-2'-O)-methyltransferase [Gammaproteobacteria bacterium]